MRQGLIHVRLVAALAAVPLFGLMLFIAALDLFFHVKLMGRQIASRMRATRTGFVRLHP